MKRCVWGKTGYAGRYDRQDIKGSPALSVKRDIPSPRADYFYKRSYRLMTGMFIALALLQV